MSARCTPETWTMGHTGKYIPIVAGAAYFEDPAVGSVLLVLSVMLIRFRTMRNAVKVKASRSLQLLVKAP